MPGNANFAAFVRNREGPKLEYDLQLLAKGRQPQFFGQMEEDLIFFFIWKTHN